MFTIGICDDDVNMRKEIRRLCDQFMFNNDLEHNYAEFSSGDELLDQIGRDETLLIDLLFLDIEMPGTDGLTTRDSIINDSGIKRVVFVSSHTESMVDAFGFKTVGFVQKPIDPNALKKKLDMVVREFQNRKVLNVSNSLTGMNYYEVDDILYLEAEGNYTHIYLKNKSPKESGKYETVSAKLGDLEKKGAFDNLVRVHKSYIVNLDYVKDITDKVKFDHRNDSVPVGRKYRDSAREAYMNYILKKAGNLL